MTDQTIPADLADKVRKLAARFRQQMEPHVSFAECVVWERAAEAVEALLPAPPRPTLADMTEEERDECRWMQCDVQGQGGAWLIVAPFDDDDEDYAHVVGRQGSKSWGFPAERITPRPDLPRMEWPGNQKPDPAPTSALPDGWRLADHKDHGRVIVTNPTPNSGGHVYFTVPTDGNMGYGCHFCDPDELTFLDSPTTKEADQ